MSGERVDLSDTLRHDYMRPRCAICGRLAGRLGGAAGNPPYLGDWFFACVFWTGDGWEHR